MFYIDPAWIVFYYCKDEEEDRESVDYMLNGSQADDATLSDINVRQESSLMVKL